MRSADELWMWAAMCALGSLASAPVTATWVPHAWSARWSVAGWTVWGAIAWTAGWAVAAVVFLVLGARRRRRMVRRVWPGSMGRS